jgi:hypothetical protein
MAEPNLQPGKAIQQDLLWNVPVKAGRQIQLPEIDLDGDFPQACEADITLCL